MSVHRLRILLLGLVFIPVIFVAVFVRSSWNTASTTAFVVEEIGYGYFANLLILLLALVTILYLENIVGR